MYTCLNAHTQIHTHCTHKHTYKHAHTLSDIKTNNYFTSLNLKYYRKFVTIKIYGSMINKYVNLIIGV